MTDQMICSAFEVLPLPGAEERMWNKINDKLRERGKEGWVLYGKRRSPLPVLLTATLVVVAALLVIFFVRRLPANSPMEPLPAATPVPEEEVETAYRSDMREIRLINARVDGMSSLRIAEEGRFLARAVLPEGMAVDHWLLNGEPTDAGDRRFSLEFDSEGVDTVEAVLREELTVRCGEKAYIQFLDENGDPAGVKYDSVGFEFDYTVPLTGEEHPGGTITAMVLPVIPLEWELDYWTIDGEKVEAEDAAKGILLRDLDHSITIDAVLIKGWVITPTGETLVLQGDGDAGLSAGPADDRPADLDSVPVNGYWEATDILKPGVSFDPLLPAPDGHVHQWEFETNIGISDGYGQRGGNLYVCTECKWEYLHELFPWGGTRDRLLSESEEQSDLQTKAQQNGAHQHLTYIVPGTETGDCMHQGERVLRCSQCGEEWTEIGYGDHDYVYVCIDVDENGGGTHKKICTVCHTVFEISGHEWAYIISTDTGYYYQCCRCGATYGYTVTDGPEGP